MDFKDIKAITVDAVGTLITPCPSVGTVYAKVLESKGITTNKSTVKQLEEAYQKLYASQVNTRKTENVTTKSEKEWWVSLVQQVLSSIYPDTKATVLKSWAKLCWEAFGRPENWDEIPGSRSPLEALERCGYPIYVFSGSDERLNKVFKDLGITAFVSDIFLATEMGYRKPHPLAFAAVQDALGLNPSEILHLSHKKEDAKGAIAAGWRAAYLGKRPAPAGSIPLQRMGDLLEHLVPQAVR